MLQSLSWEDPLEEEMATHSSILAWKIPGQRNLVCYSPWDDTELDKRKSMKFGGKNLHQKNQTIFLIVKCPPISHMTEDYKLISNDSYTESLLNVITKHKFIIKEKNRVLFLLSSKFLELRHPFKHSCRLFDLLIMLI